MSTQQTLTLHPLSAYTFTTKAAQPEEDPSVAARLQRLQNNYEDYGIRRTVEGVLVVHDHGHPHVLMIQIAKRLFQAPWRLSAAGRGRSGGAVQQARRPARARRGRSGQLWTRRGERGRRRRLGGGRLLGAVVETSFRDFHGACSFKQTGRIVYQFVR
ncbi:hypothetical protein L7F22_002493 [Adiantum nelumboides]|nr:hypothetical protein [Adiantum nelumboides]